MADQLRVMISSTARDLPEHRKQIVEACLRQGMFPLRMEDLSANPDEARETSLSLVDEADIYIGLFAHRYGYVPTTNNPDEISVSEMEYDRAVERKVARLIFVMDKSHPITIDDVEIENAAKLKAFKERVEGENIVRFFKSPEDLRVEAINSLSQLRQPDLTKFHYVSDIPAPPEAYIAHPYTLLQTPTLIGRGKELKLLTDWITGKELNLDGRTAPPDSVRIMSVVAIGGMGKSALTWKWFNDVAPQGKENLAGRMWWSFYESDATFENFIIRALAYVTKRTIDEIQRIPAAERERQILSVLDREPFLIVLDGLERILIAYARMDAAILDASKVGEEKALRKTADPRAGSLLRKFAQLRQSRVLVTSRLYPADLETNTGDPMPGTIGVNIEGLSHENAVEFWRAFGISGSRDDLLLLFNTFDKHPLLIQALAGEVKRYRKSPGNFEEWLKANPDFDPRKFTKVKEAMSHVLESALRGLNDAAERTLQTIAAFRMPTGYDTLATLLIGERKICANEPELDSVLNELEDRGLIGWDKRANRYDMHPVVRGSVWGLAKREERAVAYSSLYSHFASLPLRDWENVIRVEDLIPYVELYNSLRGLGRLEEAEELLRNQVDRLSHLAIKGGNDA